ncbi:hypothetical protein [Aureivirga sp. CE67]|uniref:hypothetical protein n=1 Tax=Aureivirga sp. CE67 TaxID=1788983 RepID=UPI0018C99D67|nr:hypothetical protein [Aureivirga sp. CE67]
MILQFSKLPPPIGGVTIHVSRLIHRANKEYKIDVLDYSKEKNMFSILRKVFSARIIHIHLSNKKLRLIFTILFKLFFKKVIITFHGKYDFKNTFDKYSLKWSSASILLNDFSFKNAQKIKQKNTYKIGAFIPPVEENIIPLKEEYSHKIELLKKKYEMVFSTNASSLVYDENGEEIYMGTQIVEYFKNKKDIALVFSSPNDRYFRFLKEKFTVVSDNIYFINEKHDFVNVIKQTDGLIRATTKDGDSLSVKEALFYQKPVFATDVVDRPSEVNTFSDFQEFDKKYKSNNLETKIVVDNSLEIFKLYKSFLK